MPSSNRSRKKKPWYRRARRWIIKRRVPIAMLGLVAVLAGVLVVAFDYQGTRSVADAGQIPAPLPTPDASPSSAAAPIAEPVLTVQRTDGTLNVLFVGDSLTGNLYASTEDAGFRPTLMRNFEAIGPTVETQGFRVNATADEVASVADVGANQNLAIVELGTNDVSRSTPADFAAEYRSLLASIRATSPDVAFLCVGTWQLPAAGNAYDTVIQDECAAQGGVYRALSDMHADQTNRGPAGVEKFGGTSDNFHPNDVGYAAIAARLFGAITLL